MQRWLWVQHDRSAKTSPHQRAYLCSVCPPLSCSAVVSPLTCLCMGPPRLQADPVNNNVLGNLATILKH